MTDLARGYTAADADKDDVMIIKAIMTTLLMYRVLYNITSCDVIIGFERFIVCQSVWNCGCH